MLYIIRLLYLTYFHLFDLFIHLFDDICVMMMGVSVSVLDGCCKVDGQGIDV